MIRAAWCVLAHQHTYSDFREEAVYATDAIAGIGRVVVSGWCPSCEARRRWEEDL